jgi:hypothetical protein
MNYPKNRRGIKESEEHYFRRLEDKKVLVRSTSATHQLADWIGQRVWDHYGVFEFQGCQVITIRGAELLFLKYLRGHRHAECFYTVEIIPFVHVNALIRTRSLKEWEYGECKVEQYQKGNAPYYMTKWRNCEWNVYGLELDPKYTFDWLNA